MAVVFITLASMNCAMEEDTASLEQQLQDKCELSEITWEDVESETMACEGPWVYDRYVEEVKRAEGCGCQIPTYCEVPRTETVYPSRTMHIPDVCQGPGGDPLPPNGPARCEPNSNAARNACDNFRQIEVANINQIEGRTVIASSFTTSMGGSSNGETTFECRMTIKYRYTAREQCGCRQWKSCSVATNAWTRTITSSGLTKTQVRQMHDQRAIGQLTRENIVPGCSTAADVSNDEADDKLIRLLDNIYDAEVVAPNSPLQQNLIKRAMMAHELLGGPRQAQVMRLYRDFPQIAPECGNNLVYEDTQCDMAQSRYCARLLSSHVVPEVVDNLYVDGCSQQLRDLFRDNASSSCLTENAQQNALFLHQAVLTKSMDRLSERISDGAEPADYDINHLKTTLHRLAYSHSVVRAHFPEEAAQEHLLLILNRFWQGAQGHRLSAVDSTDPWVPGSLYARLRDGLRDELSTDQLMALVGTAETGGTELDHAVVEAAYGSFFYPLGTGILTVPVMTEEPLLQITGQALAPLAQKLEALTLPHDVSCSVRTCTTRPRVATLLDAVARISQDLDGRSLADVLPELDGDPVTRAWAPAFSAINANQQRLVTALDSGLHDGSATESELWKILDSARARSLAYGERGLFSPALGNTLHTGLNAETRQRVTGSLTQLAGMLGGAADDLQRDLETLVQQRVNVMDRENAVAQVEADRERVQAQLYDLIERSAALRRHLNRDDSSATSVATQLMAQWEGYEGTVGTEYLTTESTTRLSFSAADVKFTNSGWKQSGNENGHTVDKVTDKTKMTVAGRTALSISASGEYAPSCALKAVRYVDQDVFLEGGAASSSLNINSATTGPEGYSINWSGSGFDASSSSSTDDLRVTIGARVEGCRKVSIPFADEGEACLYLDSSYTYARSKVDQDGKEQRTGMQLQSGLFLANTPFYAPAGALLAVELPPGETEVGHVRAVHLIKRPHTTIVFDEPADVYFVINDIDYDYDYDPCGAPDSSNTVQLDVAKVIEVGDAAEAIIARMAHTLVKVREHLPAILKRGEILPHEDELIQREATLGQIGWEGELQIPVEQYPGPLATLFEKFLAAEMMRLHAAVRLATYGREIESLLSDLHALDITLHNSLNAEYLAAMLPKWTIRGMRFNFLRHALDSYTSDMTTQLLPLLRLWYPDVLSALQSDPTLLELADPDLDLSPILLSQRLSEFARTLSASMDGAERGYPAPDEVAPSFVAVRYPRPDVMTAECSTVPSARCPRQGADPTFRWGTVSQSEALHNALGAPGDGQTTRRLVFQVDPSDVYEPVGGVGYLSCHSSLPIIRKIGIALTGYPRGSVPGDPRAVEGWLPEQSLMSFPTEEGVYSFAMANDIYRRLRNVPLFYAEQTGSYDDLKARLAADSQSLRGISPHTSIIFEIPESVVAAWRLREAQTIDLIMQVEAIPTGNPVATAPCLGVTP